MNGVRTFSLNFDGSCWPNPGGKAGYGYTLRDDARPVYDDSGTIGTGKEYSNNYAEFYALYKGLQKIIDILANEPCFNSSSSMKVNILGDSDLVIKMMSGKYRASQQKLYYPAFIKAYYAAKSLKDQGLTLKYNWVPREQNTEADKLSRT
jgi:ribonuclease HI